MEQEDWGLEFPRVNLLVGIAHTCPMNCVMCYFDHKNEPVNEGSLMSQETWSTILRKLAEEKITLGLFTPSLWGESPVHPLFVEFLEEAAEMNTKYNIYTKMDLYTCGVFFTKEKINRLLYLNKHKRLNLSTVVFGLDAYSKEVYNKIRRNGNFEIAVRNIKHFIRKREKLGLSKPRIIIEFLYQFLNMHEVKEFLGYWGAFFRNEKLKLEIGYDWSNVRFEDRDSLFIKRCNFIDMKKQEEITTLHHKALIDLGIIDETVKQESLLKNDYFEKPSGLARSLRKPCPALWEILAINYKGVATACCSDKDFVHYLGNINNGSFHDIWFGKKLKRLRIAHILGNFEYSPICTKCRNQDGRKVSKEYYVKYLRRIGREDLIHRFLERFEGGLNGA